MKLTKAYTQWLKQLKSRVRAAQIKAALKVNAELLELYWDLGKAIVEKEKEAKWGGGLIEQLSCDLSSEFPEIRGFSRTNLFYIRKWYLFYSSSMQIVPQVVGQFEKGKRKSSAVSKTKKASAEPIVPQLVGQIPWGHHREIITGCKQIKEALFYISQTVQHNWSRSVLVHQLETNLYKRKGKALTNFALTLPKHQGDLANELLKNPYHFEFLQLGESYRERSRNSAYRSVSKISAGAGRGLCLYQQAAIAGS